MAKERILGLDLGTASVGFALIDYDRMKHEGEIIRMGVRVFPETLAAKTQTPLNHQRREKRMVRRQVRRRKQRRRELNEYLHSIDLLPKYGTSEWLEVMQSDPYELRKEGLLRRLDKYELGRAIYHLAKHRHFLGRDIDLEGSTISNQQIGPDDEDSKSQQNRADLELALKKRGITLGEYLSEISPDEKKRNKLASRQVVLEEFNRILDHQRSYHEISNTELKELARIVFTQKPVFWRLKTLGTCKFIPTQRVCPSGSWLAHQRKMLEFINNISIVGNNEPLSQEAREALVITCGEKESVTWKAVRKTLRPIFQNDGYDLDDIKFNLEVDGITKIPGNPVERDLKKILGKSWVNHALKDDLRAFIHQELFQCDYGEIGNERIVILDPETRKANRSTLVDALVRKYGVLPEQANELSKLKFRTGWEPYSPEAIQCFLTQLTEGVRMGELLSSPEYEEWRTSTFPDRVQNRQKVFNLLPSPAQEEERKRLGQIRNPTVVRTSNEMRKVVNNLIRLYGRPDKIRVELARDLKNSKAQKTNIQRNIQKNEKRRKDALDNFQENNIQTPSRDDVEKWLLWQECGHICPYTGKTISFNALFGPNSRFDIEHIVPRSRGGQDGMLNKTLCDASENRDVKGNKTPYEYMCEDPDKWFHFKKRLEKMLVQVGNPHGLSEAKYKHFLREEIPKDFTERQLRDTSYTAKLAMESLTRLWTYEDGESKDGPRNKVEAISGQATARLRRLWGLDAILNVGGSKTRDDHRHHAVDALVVACAYPGTIPALLKGYYGSVERNQNKPKPQLQKPWSSIRNDAAKHCSMIVVSHKVKRKVSGELHENTVYGKTENQIPKSGKSYTQFVIRKNVGEIKPKQVDNIRDIHIRQLVRKREPHEPTVYIGKGRRVVKKVRVVEDLDATLLEKITTGHVKTGSNHHMEVFKNNEPKFKVEYRVVSLYEAASRVHKRIPIVDRNMTGFQFINSFSINEIIQIEKYEKDQSKEGFWVVKKVLSNGQLTLWKSNCAVTTDTEKPWSPRITTLIRNGGVKISVDPIGNIRTAND